MQVQPSSIMAYRDAVIAAIKGAIPVGVQIEKHDGYFDEETIKRLAFAAPAVYVAVMHARPVRAVGDFRTHVGSGEQFFTLDTACFVVTKHVNGLDASDLGWAIGETIANLAVFNAFTDPVMPADNVAIENLWSNKIDNKGLSLLSVHWNNDLLLGTDWAAASVALAGSMPGDTFGQNVPEGGDLSLTVNESVEGAAAQSFAQTIPFLTVAPAPAKAPVIAAMFAGFGQAHYAAMATSPVLMPANQRTQITFTVDPSTTATQVFFNAPFAGALNFDGSVITPRALDDAMFVLINMQVESSVLGGAVKFDIDVGSPLGPTGSVTETLFNPAGVPERVTGILFVQTLSNFMANGAKLYMTSTVPVSVISQSVTLIPQSTHSV